MRIYYEDQLMVDFNILYLKLKATCVPWRFSMCILTFARHRNSQDPCAPWCVVYTQQPNGSR